LKQPATKKTDNGHLLEKVCLRFDHLPNKKNIVVLDTNHGYGVVWKKVIKKSLKDIKVIGIETRSLKEEISLKGDNVKFLLAMDLSRFDIIDIDSYGNPVPALNAIIKNGTFKKDVHIFITYIQRSFGGLGYAILCSIGYNKRMIRKIPSLFNIHPVEKMKAYLSTIGVKKIYRYGDERTNYIFFKL